MNDEAPVILDLSRLLSRVQHHTPSGVDRVEMAYARGLHAHYGDRLRFAAVHPFGLHGRIGTSQTLQYLDELERRWATEDGGPAKRTLVAELPWLLKLLPRAPRSIPGSVYVQASPHHLTRPALVRRILRAEQARLLVLVHDLIPIDYPEYARPNGAALHRRRIETITRLADGIIANSQATALSLQPWLGRAGRDVDVHVGLLGTQEIPEPIPPATEPGAPYFVCIGTIEPRKNHLLLLNLWRTMAATMDSQAIPRLVVIGRRGWENEQVVDMLERCVGLRGHVEELNGCPDRRMHELLRGARGLLLPSFAEGYGMPVAEALSAGVPVICSDLSALREAGGDVPDFLDPLDGPAWLRHILDYAAAGPRYQAQLDRLTQWHTPSWAEHLAVVIEAIDALASTDPNLAISAS